MEQFPAGPSQYDHFALTIGQHFATGFKARSYVQQYAIRNNFAVKDVRARTRNTPHLPAAVGTQGEVRVTRLREARVTRLREARSVLSQCPWRVRFKKQLDDKWVTTELINEHPGHQLEGVNPYAYPENRSLSEEAKQAMFALVRDSRATLTQVARMVNVTYGTHILARDVYNRTYDHHEEKRTSCAKYLESLREDAYKLNRFRLPLVNIVAVDNNLHTIRVALCFVTSEQTQSYKWVLEQLSFGRSFSADVQSTLPLEYPTKYRQELSSNVQQHDAVREFMASVKQLVTSDSTELMEANLEQIETDFP
ncbi:hypothetical protein V1517DRAFT_376061 [Lipomyces orientalis]|uniref:Uncharacterized protein n=1 Tax=Lipomyces orientalis TaxID=1233043 RepID=A0ACC3TFK6_9ASCO